MKILIIIVTCLAIVGILETTTYAGPMWMFTKIHKIYAEGGCDGCCVTHPEFRVIAIDISKVYMIEKPRPWSYEQFMKEYACKTPQGDMLINTEGGTYLYVETNRESSVVIWVLEKYEDVFSALGGEDWKYWNQQED